MQVETAMVLPRINLPTDPYGITLPLPLSPSLATILRTEIAAMRDHRQRVARAGSPLDGPILAETLLDARTHATPQQLAGFLKNYPEDPAAPRIYAALLRGLPWNAPLPSGPPSLRLNPPGAGDLAEDTVGCEKARTALTAGHDHLAREIAREGFLNSHRTDGACAYIAGLSAYKLGLSSARWFEAASLAPNAGTGLQAAGAFWAARAHQHAGEVQLAHQWAERAASFPHSLHGRLTLVLLDRHDPARDRGLILAGVSGRDHATLGEAELALIGETPAGERLFAALQINERHWAEEAARQIWQESAATPQLRRAILLLSSALRFDGMVADARASLLPGDLPSAPLRPRGGFKLQPALVYAVARVESNFDPKAQSGAGASGLMQLRAEAAGLTDLKPASVAHLLQNPARNLDLGQRYLARLSERDMAGDDLLLVLASYNSGQGRVASWKIDPASDPMMFLETIPTNETRHFVQRILSHCWAYAARFSLPAPGLTQLAAGAWPKFSQTAMLTRQ